jgi:hypothetical protein
MRPIDNPSRLTPDERLSEVAGILAAGILRLRARAALPEEPGDSDDPENRDERGVSCLEVSAETVLSVNHDG